MSIENKAKALVAQLLGENENFSAPYDEVFNFVKKYHHGGVVDPYTFNSPYWREKIAKGWDPSKDPLYVVKDGKFFVRNPKNMGGKGSTWDHSIWAHGKPSPELLAALPDFKWHLVSDHNEPGGFQIAAENAVEDPKKPWNTSFVPVGTHPDVWFHVARRHPDIGKNGLMGHMYDPQGLSAIKRTFLFRPLPTQNETLKDAADHLAHIFYTQTDWQKGFDLYQIDTTGLRLRSDLNMPDGLWVYYDGPIKLERMKLVARSNSKNQFPASINRLV
jgi:hypothetical protein